MKEKPSALEIIGKLLPFLVCAVLFTMPQAAAIAFDDEISDEDKETFDQILEPVLKVYNLVKYAASAKLSWCFCLQESAT